MKKIVFFFVFSLLITSCASHGFVGKGHGPATKVADTSVSYHRSKIKKEPKAPTIVKTKTANRNGLYGKKGAKPPKTQTSYASR